MDDDHCVITTQHRICEIPIAADKRQFSVFVNMSVACTLQNDAANIKKMIPSARKRGKIFQKTRIAITATKKRFNDTSGWI
ncbi:MAG: hypothetical protein IKO23_05695 [Bacteroidales bacterium]|nr:hypothetical protein [Bacteroidales bacterium]